MDHNKDHNWGPFPKLADQLACIPSTDFGYDRSWNEKVEEFGGLWGYYGQGLWTAEFPPVRQTWHSLAPRRQSLSLRGLSPRALIMLARQLFRPRKNSIVAPQKVTETLAETLIECHAWLSARNLRYLEPWLNHSFAQEIPLGLTTVSQKGIAWTLIAYALDSGGPRRFLHNAPLSKLYDLDACALPGDFLTQHINIEVLMKSLPTKLPLELSLASESRKPGGLRTSHLLNVYPALALKTSVLARAWLVASNRLIENSPLTMLVYSDVIEPAASKTEKGGASLALKPVMELGAEKTAWRELWLSHLARSIVGGLLSPPPVFEHWQDAEKKRQKIESDAARWVKEQILLMRRLETYPGLLEARQKCTALRHQMLKQYCERIGLMARLFESSDSGAIFLHLRTLDMLVRHIVSASTVEMIDQWDTLKHSARLIDPRNVLFDGQGVCFIRFAQVLFGEQWERNLQDVLTSETYQEARKDLRQNLEKFLQGPRQMEESALKSFAEQAGVPLRSAQLLIGRFSNDETHGVKLPFQSPDDQGEAPGTILGNWLGWLLELFPATSIQTHTRQEQVEIYE